MSNSKATSSGVSFAGLLTVAFIVLKLCDVIDWSWWWVFSPFWIPFAVIIVIFLIGILLIALGLRSDKKPKK